MPYFNPSAIKRDEYDYISGNLKIWFAEGNPYDFYNVPSRIWEGLCSANSKGR